MAISKDKEKGYIGSEQELKDYQALVSSMIKQIDVLRAHIDRERTRIYFVGMHNKAGMKPLDSRTKTGGIIDGITDKLGFPCVKTNLCNVEYKPESEEMQKHVDLWHETHKPRGTDFVVLLGAWVKEEFDNRGIPVITLPHPASTFGGKKKSEYIDDAVAKIYKEVDAYKSNHKGMNFRKLRADFFNECTRPEDKNNPNSLVDFNCMPHHVFDWFKKKIQSND